MQATEPPAFVQRDRELAPLTTLELGGRARFFARPGDAAELEQARLWAASEGLRIVPLGGGSNVVVVDEGVDALVLQVGPSSRAARHHGGELLVRAEAGHPWSELALWCAQNNWAGTECLVGIPGSVGAVPIQNVGAYGQEVSEVLESVEVVDLATGAAHVLSPAECALGYRDSAFKRGAPGFDTLLVTAVTLRLRPGGAPCLRYAELAREAQRASARALPAVASLVLSLRRAKAMVWSPDGPDRRSAGSFFVNPIVDDALADAVERAALERGWCASASEVPRWPAGAGRSKLAAGWLVERSGFTRGHREGPVGLSSRHALALVHHGGGTTTQLLALAEKVREGVREATGVTLTMEPVILR